MADIDEYRRDKMTVDFFRLFLFLQTVQHFLIPTYALDSHSQAFIQTDNHLTYIVGDVQGMPVEKHGQNFLDLGLLGDSFLQGAVRLYPPMLDFQEQAVGMPLMEQVTVQNADPKNSLHLLSISGSTVHFHCSFFQAKMVPPGGNTTFDVVFLARQVGNVENTLYIHTSKGSFKYQVFGVGIPNPYRLRPYLGAKVPLNSTFSPLIHMHNPHSSTLQVIEMFSSEGDLHLELPTGGKEAPQKLWEIPPYETKPVMRANFIGRVENNHTAFIRIKTNQEKSQGLLVLPVEVEVSAVPGIYSAQEMVDFGIVRTIDDPKTVDLNLINTGNRPIHITSITLSPPNDAVSLDFRPIKLQPDSSHHTTVAHLTFKGSLALLPRQWSGKIIIKSKNNVHKVVVPYQAQVLCGSLIYNANNTHFFSPKFLRNSSKPMTFTNIFNFSVVIYNISLPEEAQKYFSIVNFTRPVILRPQQTATPFLIKFTPNTTQIRLNTMLIVHTNASVFRIPIIVYNGLLNVIYHRPGKIKGQIDFGTMGVGENRSLIFTVRNDNPVMLVVPERSTYQNRSLIKLVLLGIEKGNGSMLTREHNSSEIDLDNVMLQPYHFAVFSVDMLAPDIEGAFSADILLVTQFQDLYIPVTVRTAEGSLTPIPDKFVFDKMYPGKTLYKVLQMHSTFDETMEVTQLTFQPPDSRFYYQPSDRGQVYLEPDKNNIIGKIYFDAKKECKSDCYVGLPTYTPAGHQWLLGLSLDHEVADTDQYLYSYLREKWNNIDKSEQNTANVTIELDTNLVRGFLFSAQAHLHWPSLVKKYKIHFPLTQIGNTSLSDFIVENTGDVPVLIQILPLPLYPNPQAILDLLGQRLSADLNDYIETEDMSVFTLPDIEQYNTNLNSTIPSNRKNIENTLGVRPHINTLSTILTPGVKIKVRVGFQPKDDISRTSLILIRNNLTIIDAIVVQGQGGRGEMKFNNRKVGTSTPLLFEMTEKVLKNCDRKKPGKNMVPNFTAKKGFIMQNSGELPFYVHGFSINDSPWQGYGFRVLESEGFEMLPNSSKRIDIAFTPDFTMSRIRRLLTVYTSVGPPANFTLQATVPPYMLSKCAAALPRPNWEPVLYYSVICIMSFLLFCILLAGYFEADRIFVADILKRKLKISSATQTFDKNKIFDLKSVAGFVLKPPSVSETRPNVTIPRFNHEMTNGHIDIQPRKEMWLGRLIKGVFRGLTFWKRSYLASRLPAPTRQTSQENKEVIVANGVKPSEPTEFVKEETTTDNVTIEKVPHVPPMRGVRKSKSSRRQQEVIAVDDASDRKHNKQDSAINGEQRKTFSDQNKLDTDKSSPERNQSTGKKSDKADSSGLEPITIFTNVETPEVDVSKSEGKHRNKRRSYSLRSNNKDVTKPRSSSMSNLDDRDETSSTTTESSGFDGDEKNSSARDSTPERPAPKTKKTKIRNKMGSATYGSPADDNNDDDFELHTKCKSHSKIKVNPKEAFGGNILQPSTLELPYSLEVKKPLEQESNETKAAPELKAKKASRSGKLKTKRDLRLNIVDGETSTDHEKDSPAPLWDIPIPGLAPGDLTDISLQTEIFAQKHARPCLQVNGFLPEPPSTSSRSSSYSSIVSNSSPDAAGKVKVVKPAADTKKPGIPFMPPIEMPNSAKNLSTKPPSGASSKARNVWNNLPTSSMTLDPMSSSFGLQTIQEASHRPAYGLDSTDLDNFTQASEYSSYPKNDGGYSYPGAVDQLTPATMMQRLQAERRRRVQEHDQLVRSREEWPGFDMPPVSSDSLWDNDYNPAQASWSTATGSPPTSVQQSGSSWGNLANNGWNNMASIWSQTPGDASPETLTAGNAFLEPTPPVELESFPAVASVPTSTGQQSDTMGSFDPFNSMSEIWSPGLPTSSASTNWGFVNHPEDENN